MQWPARARALAVATAVLLLHAVVIFALAKQDETATRPASHPIRIALLGAEMPPQPSQKQATQPPLKAAQEPSPDRNRNRNSYRGSLGTGQRPTAANTDTDTNADRRKQTQTQAVAVASASTLNSLQDLASNEKRGSVADRPESELAAPATSGVLNTRPAPTALAVAMPANTSKIGEQKVELPLTAADYLQNPRPVYPSLSRRLNEQGQVVHSVTIGPDGKALGAQLVKSSGYERLDRAAWETVMRWRYVPGKRGGTPTVMSVDVPITWVLE
ncbi:MAG: hypothetical protein RL459_622 [Pseudomonadota bacterium]